MTRNNEKFFQNLVMEDLNYIIKNIQSYLYKQTSSCTKRKIMKIHIMITTVKRIESAHAALNCFL